MSVPQQIRADPLRRPKRFVAAGTALALLNVAFLANQLVSTWQADKPYFPEEQDNIFKIDVFAIIQIIGAVLFLWFIWTPLWLPHPKDSEC